MGWSVGYAQPLELDALYGPPLAVHGAVPEGTKGAVPLTLVESVSGLIPVPASFRLGNGKPPYP